MTAQMVHFGISVFDLDRSVEWYCRYFGFVETKRFNKPELEISGATLTLGDGMLEILAPFRICKSDASAGGLIENLRNVGSNHFALSVDSVAECFGQMKTDGVCMVSELIGGKFFFCKDPDGTLVEVKQA